MLETVPPEFFPDLTDDQRDMLFTLVRPWVDERDWDLVWNQSAMVLHLGVRMALSHPDVARAILHALEADYQRRTGRPAERLEVITMGCVDAMAQVTW